MEKTNVGTARGEFDIRYLCVCETWDVINRTAFDCEYGNIMSTIEKHVSYELRKNKQRILFCLL